MSTIVTRAGKGSPLTWNEVDNNFTNLNTDKYQSGSNVSLGTIAGTTITSSALTSGRVTFASTGGLLADSANLVFTGTNFGIGTSSPSQKLDVDNGSSAVRIRVASTGSVNSDIAFYNGLNSCSVGINSAGSAFFYTGGAYPMIFSTNATERMRISDTGNVGIGLTAPVTNLNVDTYFASSNAKNGAIRVNQFGGSTNYGMSEYISAYGLYEGSTYTVSGNRNPIGTTASQITQAGGVIAFATNSGLTAGTSFTPTERMRIDSSGNLGIGTSSPSTFGKFAVTGSVGTIYFDAGATGIAYSYNGPNYISAKGGSSGSLVFETGGAVERMRLDALGNLALGVSTAAAKFDVAFSDNSRFLLGFGANLDNYYTSGTSGTQIFRTGTTERMRLDSSGNLGLGVTPSAWNNGKAVEVSYVGNALFAKSSVDTFLTSGTYQTNNVWYRADTNIPAFYNIYNGTHIWKTGVTSGTANASYTPTTAMTLDASGNLGIGNTTPSSFSVAADNLVVGTTSGDNGITIVSGTSSQGSVFFADGSATAPQQAAGYLIYVHGTDYMALGTANTERMRINASGNLIVRGTTQYSSAITTITGGLAGTNQNLALVQTDNTSSHDKIFFVNTNGIVGKVTTSGSTTTYATSSDYRLKENIAPMTGALDTIAQLKPVTYNWKSDGSDGQGFIAHELAEVVPDCVIGEKDATHEEEYEISPAIPAVLDEEGNEVTPAVEAVMGTRTVPVYQGIDTSFLVATLTAAIQELKAELDITKAKVAALEAA